MKLSFSLKKIALLITLVTSATVVFGYFLVRTSSAYKVAEAHAKSDFQVKKKAGEILEIRFRPWYGFNIVESSIDGEAAIEFLVVSRSGSFFYATKLIKSAGVWSVMESNIKSP